MADRQGARLARRRGGAVALVGLALGLGAVLAQGAGLGLAGVLGPASAALIALGAMLVLVGGVMRPAQRLAFRHGIPAGRLRRLILRRRLLRWWFGVDGNGVAVDD